MLPSPFYLFIGPFKLAFTRGRFYTDPKFRLKLLPTALLMPVLPNTALLMPVLPNTALLMLMLFITALFMPVLLIAELFLYMRFISLMVLLFYILASSWLPLCPFLVLLATPLYFTCLCLIWLKLLLRFIWITLFLITCFSYSSLCT